ncbi:hypothetical protein [Heyndrickxia acidicola]|uniref:Integrase n=1 Tax=Heyndrickxia acidicola TaxID=209389 RepID=A0ABU6MEJ6_9BACI|nr:hypothetical protein [Heyndrickxia acidicola]MED1203095.1 hypothetical protein [Heyndrickxia acidicola]
MMRHHSIRSIIAYCKKATLKSLAIRMRIENNAFRVIDSSGLEPHKEELQEP